MLRLPFLGPVLSQLASSLRPCADLQSADVIDSPPHPCLLLFVSESGCHVAQAVALNSPSSRTSLPPPATSSVLDLEVCVTTVCAQFVQYWALI